MPLKTNTLVQYPFYKGHDPNKWKFIGKWDSENWIKGVYTENINNENIDQHNLICGQGVIAIEDDTVNNNGD